jgi:hypothetical protein
MAGDCFHALNDRRMVEVLRTIHMLLLTLDATTRRGFHFLLMLAVRSRAKRTNQQAFWEREVTARSTMEGDSGEKTAIQRRRNQQTRQNRALKSEMNS